MSVSETAIFGDVEELSRRYGTPLVVYSEHMLNANAVMLQQAISPHAQIAYSVKANPAPKIIKFFADQGFMIEVVSQGELQLVVSLGVDSKTVIFNGPAKSREDISAAIDEKIFILFAESIGEIRRIASIKRKSAQLNVGIRVNPESLHTSSVLKMGGLSSQFGIDESDIPEAIRLIESEGLRYGGLMMYAGSQCSDAATITRHTDELMVIETRLRGMGLPPAPILDFGGGFPVSESSSDSPLDIDELKSSLGGLFCESCLFQSHEKPQAIFESGRYLVGKAGLLVAKVLDVKTSQGKRYAVLDAGLNVIGVRQMSYRDAPPLVEVLRGCAKDELSEVCLVGPSCTPIDVVHPAIMAPSLEEGDLVVMPHFGAYTLSYSAINFCGRPIPAEILVRENGHVELVRHRGRLENACGVGYEV